MEKKIRHEAVNNKPPKDSPPNKDRKKMSLSRRIKLCVLKIQHLIEKDLWRSNAKGKKGFWHKVLRVLLIAIRSFNNDDLMRKSAALAYRSILAVVPLLAVLIGVAKGFGVQDMLRKSLEDIGPMHSEEWANIYSFVDNTLAYANSGLFMGVGIISLFYIVYVLLSDVELNLNIMWEIKSVRPIKERISTYLGLLFILPILIVTSSGITLAMRTMTSTFLGDYIILGKTASFLLRLTPFILIIFAFTGMFILLPNTKVRFVPAFIGGTLAGIIFQLFQLLYMSGVMWVSQYNAIYGSLAFFFLMLLWMQFTWVIILFSAKLAFAIQNIDHYFYINEVNNASRRYRDFLSLVVMHSITERFIREGDTKPHNAASLAEECSIPISMVESILQKLLSLGLIAEVLQGKNRHDGFYIPFNNPQSITAGEVLDRIDIDGSEDFDIDRTGHYNQLWDCIMKSRKGLTSPPCTLPLNELKTIPHNQQNSV